MVKRFLSVWLTLSLALSLFSACASTPKTVMYVGDSAISREEYNYTYNTQVRDFYDAYSSYLSYFGIDPDKPLENRPAPLRRREARGQIISWIRPRPF